MADKCGTYFPHKGFEDATGCLLENHHTPDHICQEANGKFIEWKEDYKCPCGCWDEYEALGDACIIYSEITAGEANKRVNHHHPNE